MTDNRHSPAAGLDVTRTVDVTCAREVAAVVRDLLERRYPGSGFAIVERVGSDVERLYHGRFPGYHACETGYHNLQHILDVTLAMARLVDGHEQSVAPAQRLGPELALAGICAALFHDAGYIRRRGDRRHHSGAAYTRIHVKRSARWLRDYLPRVGLDDIVGPCSRVVHFTNSNLQPGRVPNRGRHERRLGELLGSADLLAQMADLDYVQKCRDHLYQEFVVAGIAGRNDPVTFLGYRYHSSRDLVEKTPGFMRWAVQERMKKSLRGAFAFVEAHFGGSNPYMEAIDANYRQLQTELAGSAD